MDVELKQAYVVLKKTKITKTILNQSANVLYKDVNVKDIIGWCFDGKNKKVVSYNTDLKIINVSVYIRTYKVVEITKDNLIGYLSNSGYDKDELYIINTNTHELLGSFALYVYTNEGVKDYNFQTFKEVEAKIKILDEYCAKVENAGQFYL